MNSIFSEIYLDLQHKTIETVNIKQYDYNYRFIKITVTDNGNLYTLLPDMQAEIKICKSDNYHIAEFATIDTTNNCILIKLTEQMTSIYGICDAEITLFNDNGVISTMPFIINVEKCAIQNKDIISTDEYGVLEDLIVEAEKTIDKVNKDYTYVIESAQASANAAKVSESNAKISEINAKTSETNAKNYETNSKNSEFNAKESEVSAEESATLATTKAIEASTSASNANTSANKAKESETNAKISETNAKASEDNAYSSALNAKTSETNASNSATSASNSALSATSSANTANLKATEASNSASSAYTSATTATTKASEASTYATKAESFAQGGTGTRENEDVDNTQYYYEQIKQISEHLNGTLLPMGTINFSQLQSQTKQPGYMFNISDEFTTTSDFKEGAGYVYPAGTNVYYTADGKWDCLAGTMVTGIKGNAESSYRKGNVNITMSDLGYENVENKSSETIRGELTKENVTSALGYTPPTTNTTYGVATSSVLGLVKSGTDITVDSSGNVSVNDDSHNHVISNVDGLQGALDGKAASIHSHDYVPLSGNSTVNGAITFGKSDDYGIRTNNNFGRIGDSTNQFYEVYSYIIYEDKTKLTDKYAPISHTHTKSQITDFPTSLPANGGNADTIDGYDSSYFCMYNDSRLSNARPASDVYAWAKASSKPSYSWNEITSKPSSFPPSSHSHDSVNYATYLKSTYINASYQWGASCFGSFRSDTIVDLVGSAIQGRNINNSAWIAFNGSAFNQQSSKRYKKNVEDMTEEYANKLLDIHVVKFDYINELDGINQYGVIAEEVAEIETHPVYFVKDDNGNEQAEGIDYSKFVPQLIKLCQIQQKEINELKQIIQK